MSNIGGQSQYEGPGLLQRIELPSDADPTADNEVVFFKYGSEPFELPASVNFGASMDLFRNEQNSIVGVLEHNVNSYQADRTNFGFEYGWNNTFFGRMGYTSTFQRDRDFRTGSAKWGGLTLGAGVNYKMGENFAAKVDYAYTNYGQLGGVHYFTVGLGF